MVHCKWKWQLLAVFRSSAERKKIKHLSKYWGGQHRTTPARQILGVATPAALTPMGASRLGVVTWLERDADLHMALLMPLPLTVSCFSKIQIGFTFLVPAHLGSPGKRAVKRVCVWGVADDGVKPQLFAKLSNIIRGAHVSNTDYFHNTLCT